jgi:peptide/nickel transport system substrate-binding protein
MKRTFLVLSILVVAAMLFSACAPTPEPEAPAAPTEAAQPAPTEAMEEPAEAVEEPAAEEPAEEPAAAEGPQGGEIIMADFEPNTMNPYIASEAIARACIALANRGLVGIDPDGKWFPVMAAEIPTAENGGVADDGKTITWKLRPDLKWSDGKPLTSEDIKFTWEAVIHPESTATQTQGFNLIESIETPDELTAVVKYSEFYAPWMTQFALGILPKSAGEPADMGNWGWNRTLEPTNGPFILTEWVAADHMTYERNPHWYEEGKPYLDKILYPIVDELETQRQMLLAGDNDMHHWLDSEYVSEMRDQGMDVQVSPSPYWRRIQFKLSAFGDDRPSPPAEPHEILGDPKVREAFFYAFDKPEIVYNWVDPVYSKSMFYLGEFNCEDQVEDYVYDPDKARAMLEEAGWIDQDGNGVRECHGCMYAEEGTPMRLMISTYSGWGEEDNQIVVVEQLGEVGVDVYVQNFEATVLYGTYGEGSPARRGEYDILYWDYELGVDPHSKAEEFYASWRIPTEEDPAGFNCTRVADEEIDEWLQIAGSTPDVPTRKEAYCNIANKIRNEIFQEYAIGVPTSPSASSPRTKGWVANEAFMPYSVFGWDAENWYIEE